jgi:pimeloyl-ACP methyl ester carboxylesterase
MKELKKIYILHGWAYTTEKWGPFVLDLKKKGFDVELLKIPGLTAPLSEVWNLDNYVAWLKDILDKEKEVILLGHSNGGRISLAYTAKYPKYIKHLILIDSAGIYHNELPIRLKRFVFGRAAKVGKLFTKSKKMRAMLYRFTREHDYEKADPIVRQTMLNLIRADLQDILPTVSVPTTIIWGQEDTVTPVHDGELMHEKIPHATFHTVQDARHSPMFTHEEKVAEIIEKNI